MIRLAASGLGEDLCREVAPSLRGATIDPHAPPKECDAAVFLGPEFPDLDAIELLLHAGKPVLIACEMCVPDFALTILAAAGQQSQAQLVAVNPERYLPSRQLIRQQLDAGNLGTVGLIRIHRWSPPHPFKGPAPLVRDLDLASWLVGKPPNLVHAVEPSGNDRNALSAPAVLVHLGFPGGAMALIDHVRSLPHGEGYQSLSVIGSAGAAYADDHQNMQLLYRGGRPQGVRTDEGIRQVTAMLQEFVDGLHASDDTSDGLAAWRGAWAMIEAVQQSLQSHQAVPLEGN